MTAGAGGFTSGRATALGLCKAALSRALSRSQAKPCPAAELRQEPNSPFFSPIKGSGEVSTRERTETCTRSQETLREVFGGEFPPV